MDPVTPHLSNTIPIFKTAAELSTHYAAVRKRLNSPRSFEHLQRQIKELEAENDELRKENARLRERLDGPPPPRPTGLAGILLDISEKHGIPISQLKGPSRKRYLMMARFEFCYRAMAETNLTPAQIGMRLGGRDHSTVLHAMVKHCHANGLPVPRGSQLNVERYLT